MTTDVKQKKFFVRTMVGVEEDSSQDNVRHRYPVLWESGEVTPAGARVQILTRRDGGRLVPLRKQRFIPSGKHALFHLAPGVHCIVLEYNDTEEMYHGYIWNLVKVKKVYPQAGGGERTVGASWSLVNELKGDFYTRTYRHHSPEMEKFNGAIRAAEQKLDFIVSSAVPSWVLDVQKPLPVGQPQTNRRNTPSIGDILRTAPEFTEETKKFRAVEPQGEAVLEPVVVVEKIPPAKLPQLKKPEGKEVLKSFADIGEFLVK